MGKLLKLGTKLKYPLTIGRLLKSPGDEIHKQEPIMQFKFTWKQRVGDPFGEEWEEDQTTIADWDSPTEGHIKLWKVHEGMVIEKDIPFVEIEESCLHAVQYFGLCCFCGKDMTQVTWASSSDDTVYAKINMIHNQTSLTISEDEASKAEQELQRRLLKNRKLSLVVDLDQTIIHACIEPTIGEWQNDPTSPNYEAVKEVRSFQLNDDWPRGVASGCWYYIKMRPGLKNFLNRISEMYELHVYTMGTRAYAMNIAKIVDPEKKLFGDRIISRDENGSITTKSLSRLFPVNTKMVVIIDDRADVWPQNRSNLVKVVPYDFFLGIGDINSSFLPKREEMFKITSIPEKKEVVSEKKETIEPVKVDSITDDNIIESNADNKASAQAKEDNSQENSKANALQELLSMGGGEVEEEARRLQQTVEQEKLLEKQFKERPLLHMQKKLDKEEIKDEAAKKNPSSKPEDNIHHKHNLLKDDDVELKYLERNLTHLHKSFYDEYDNAVVKAGYKDNSKGTDPNYDVLNLNIVPDIGNLLPRLKAQTFVGCVIATAGLFLFNQDLLKLKTEFGAKLVNKVNRRCTHLIVSTDSPSTNEVRQALRYPQIKIVNKDWLKDSISKWEKEDETPYLIHVRRENNPLDEQLHEDLAMLSTQPSDDEGPSNNGDETSRLTHASRTDGKDVFPPKIKVESQTNGLGSIDWKGVDEELAEFMSEEDFENDSDTSETMGLKRGREEITDDAENENENSLSKRQKLASEHQSRLHEVITLNQNQMNDTIALTTPKITTDSEETGDLNENLTMETSGGLDGDSELEALLMAEFEKEEVEEEKTTNIESRENATSESGENTSTVSGK